MGVTVLLATVFTFELAQGKKKYFPLKIPQRVFKLGLWSSGGERKEEEGVEESQYHQRRWVKALPAQRGEEWMLGKVNSFSDAIGEWETGCPAKKKTQPMNFLVLHMCKAFSVNTNSLDHPLLRRIWVSRCEWDWKDITLKWTGWWTSLALKFFFFLIIIKVVLEF